MTFFRPKNNNPERLRSTVFINFSQQIQTLNQALQEKEPALKEELETVGGGDGHGTADVPIHVRLVLDRAKRILASLQRIEAQFKQDTRDDLSDIQLENLTKIAHYTARCLPESVQILQMYTTYMTPEEIQQYKETADSISGLSNTHQQLAGCVLQILGAVVFISLIVTSIYLSLGLSIPLILGLTGSIGSVGIGSYLNQRNAYDQLTADVHKTLNSAACNKDVSRHETEDPDCGYLTKIEYSIMASLGGYSLG